MTSKVISLSCDRRGELTGLEQPGYYPGHSTWRKRRTGKKPLEGRSQSGSKGSPDPLFFATGNRLVGCRDRPYHTSGRSCARTHNSYPVDPRRTALSRIRSTGFAMRICRRIRRHTGSRRRLSKRWRRTFPESFVDSDRTSAGTHPEIACMMESQTPKTPCGRKCPCIVSGRCSWKTASRLIIRTHGRGMRSVSAARLIPADTCAWRTACRSHGKKMNNATNGMRRLIRYPS